MTPIIGLMPGDPTGIGPEITAKVLAVGELRGKARLVVIGDARVLEMGQRDAGTSLPVRRYASLREVDWSDESSVPLVDLGNIDPSAFPRGAVSAEAGKLTGDTLKAMIGMALEGSLDAVSFAPLNKGALHKGGWHYHDEHQMFAALTNHQGFFGEMNVTPQFSTFRVTSHVSLREALDLITPQRIRDAAHLADSTLRAMGHERPRIGVAALNPHGGEGGLFGREEIEFISPTIEALKREGLALTGPVPADTIFVRALAGEFDGVVTMYHDQGQVATKLLAFNKGVTVTAGLPTVFTTPAHGTAFDIVGKGSANPGALTQALLIAAKLASARRTQKAAA
jgi:4-hydroxythreonine-4-phosphate dehydrogenase